MTYLTYRLENTQREWPHFDLTYMPPVPVDWEDEGWHNDAAPILGVPLPADDSHELRVLVDYADPALRYDREGAERYAAWYHDYRRDLEVMLYLGDDWQECVAAVEAFRVGYEAAVGVK